MKYLKRLVMFFSIFLLYIVFKEFVGFYLQMRALNIYLGYGVVGASSLFFIYFCLVPIYKILRIPCQYAPVFDKSKEQKLIENRIDNYRSNLFLKEQNFDMDVISPTKEDYAKVIAVFEKEAEQIRRKHISQIFYSTTVAQNGFLDALIILSSSINHIKSIFILYNGRVNNRDLLNIGKNVYYSVLIGGSEGVEYVTDEIVTKLASDTVKSIPFIDKIIASLADGLVNSVLLTRISYLTENYCKMTYLEKSSDLLPPTSFIIKSSKSITSGIIDNIYSSLKKIAVEKGSNFTQIAINPIGYVLERTIDKQEKYDGDTKIRLKEQARIIGNPVLYGVGKLINVMKKGKK